MRESRCDRLPVISDMRIIPVTGAFTIAEKYPAMPRIMKLSIYMSYPVILANKAPSSEPSTSRGRNMPPGVPEPKLIIEKTYFVTRSSKSIATVNLFSDRMSTRWLPPPKT